MQSIELLFDEATEERLRADWRALADAGLPSLADHPSDTNRPHVTVAVADDGGLDRAEEATRAVAAGWGLGGAGLAGLVGAPILFGGHRGRWVLARQVVASRPLLVLQAAVHRAIEHNAPDATVSDLTRPDGWTPHVTLAHRIGVDDLPAALQALDVEPVAARFAGLRLWDAPSKQITSLTSQG